MPEINKKSMLLEMVGTFVIVYIGGWSVQWNYTRMVDIVSASLSQGLTLAVMIYIAHPISDAHFNPVVSLICALTGHQRWNDTLIYIASQAVGSILAGVFLKLQSRDLWQGEVKNQLGYPMVTQNTSVVAAFFAEVIATFSFLFTIYAVYYHRQAPPGTCAAVIGCTLMFNILSIGNMTGCALNPFRVFGPSFFGMGFLYPRGEWIYYVAPLVGGLLGGFTYHILFMEEDNPDWKDKTLDNKIEKVN
jgi:aquaporin Z